MLSGRWFFCWTNVTSCRTWRWKQSWKTWQVGFVVFLLFVRFTQKSQGREMGKTSILSRWHGNCCWGERRMGSPKLTCAGDQCCTFKRKCIFWYNLFIWIFKCQVIFHHLQQVLVATSMPTHWNKLVQLNIWLLFCCFYSVFLYSIFGVKSDLAIFMCLVISKIA